jgi:DNA-binding MarR family transcriptional regulator
VDTHQTFNSFMIQVFNEIMNIQEKAVITEEFKDISNNDMHIIEAIGNQESRNMSSVAKSLSVTVGTLTIAINNLVKKGYVDRIRSDEDRRVVLISLTSKGLKAFEHHQNFHEEMIQAMIADLDEEEKEVLVRAITNLKDFFHDRMK